MCICGARLCLNVYNGFYGTEDHEKVIGYMCFFSEREREKALYFILEFLGSLPYILTLLRSKSIP